jgi:hypothetical protein
LHRMTCINPCSNFSSHFVKNLNHGCSLL